MGRSVSRSDLIKVAKLYYLGDMSQMEIADIMGLSRTKVSRMLSQARSNKVVQFTISSSHEPPSELQERLKAHFGLCHVKVVDSSASRVDTKMAAAKAAAAYLDGILQDNMKIGVVWGSTMKYMVKYFQPSRKVQNATVVEMIGGLRSELDMDTRELTRQLAQKIDAQCSLLHAPLVMSNQAVRDILLQEPEIKAHFKLFDSLDVALCGVGTNVPEGSFLYRAGYISLAQAKELCEAGMATELCGSRVYRDGSARAYFLSNRLINIDLEQLRKIPTVVTVAVGADKAESIIASARGGYMNALFTDEIAALTILSKLESETKQHDK